MIAGLGGKTPRVAESAFVSQNACVVGDVEIGENCIIWPGAVIRADYGSIRIGKDVWIEDNVVVHSDIPGLDIGDNVIIGHGAVVNGRRIGNKVLVGINASVLHETEIGDRCVIAAGAVVTQGMKIPSGSFVAGVPGKITAEVSEKHMKWVEGDRQIAIRWVQEYKKQGL